jgi:hypothetical protein
MGLKVKSKKTASDDYEELAHQIADLIWKCVQRDAPIKSSHGRESLRMGHSGHEHQIDVVIEGIEDLFLIECKLSGRTIEVGDVCEFAYRVIDISRTFAGKTHSAMFAPKGYQPGAKLIAKDAMIDLGIVESIEEFTVLYRDHFLAHCKPATLVASVVPPTVVISDPPPKAPDVTDA